MNVLGINNAIANKNFQNQKQSPSFGTALISGKNYPVELKRALVDINTPVRMAKGQGKETFMAFLKAPILVAKTLLNPLH